MGLRRIGYRGQQSNSFIEFYGVFAKNILQPMEVISLSRKEIKTKQGNFMEITDVLEGD